MGPVCVKLIGSRVRWAEGGAVRAGFTDSSRFGLAAQDEQETFSQHSPSYLRPDVHGKNRDYHLYAGRYLCGPGKNTNRTQCKIEDNNFRYFALRSSAGEENFKKGRAIFTPGTDELQTALKYTFHIHNTNDTQARFKVEPVIDLVDSEDPFKIARTWSFSIAAYFT
ncbi:unnamed protein product [Larinioides sclopetarius]|uniref:Uncharacterized protein n=1 Tax=Larinioides sclopetarius TaxID=280406 RepID=A0AAV2A9W8_9ARAC